MWVLTFIKLMYHSRRPEFQVFYPHLRDAPPGGCNEGLFPSNNIVSMLKIEKAAWVLQGFATTFYTIFAIVM